MKSIFHQNPRNIKFDDSQSRPFDEPNACDTAEHEMAEDMNSALTDLQKPFSDKNSNHKSEDNVNDGQEPFSSSSRLWHGDGDTKTAAVHVRSQLKT